MATKIWRGIMPAIAQVSTLTVGGTVAGGETFTVTVGNASYAVVAAASGAAAAAVQIHAVLVSAAVPNQFREVTWTVAGSVITATANVPGVPITISTAATGSATFVTATPTAATGPNFANVAGNWSGVTLPIAGDDLIIPDDSPAILYGLTSMTALFASVTVATRFRERIGLPNYNRLGYLEYRDRYWSINTSILTIGEPTAAAITSQRVKFDLKATATNISVHRTGSGDTTERGVELIGGSNAVLSVSSGSVAASSVAGEASDFASVTIGNQANVLLGAACVADTVVNRGILQANCVLPDLDVEAGRVTANAQITALDVAGGTVDYTSNATITSASVGPGNLRCLSQRPTTITALTMRRSGLFHEPNENVTITTLTASGVSQILT